MAIAASDALRVPSLRPRLASAILDKLRYAVGKDVAHAHGHDWYIATALAVRDQAVDRWIATTRRIYATRQKRVYYLSVEFLIGRLLSEYLCNLQLTDTCREALAGLGVDLDRIKELEPDAALGNGGLAGSPPASWRAWRPWASPASATASAISTACSGSCSATAGRSSSRRTGWPSAIPGSSSARGHLRDRLRRGGARRRRSARQVWRPAERVRAIAYDTPIVGWEGRWVNTLRLWSAGAANLMRFDQFNSGDYMGAVADQVRSENIVRILYPNDDTPAGQSCA